MGAGSCLGQRRRVGGSSGGGEGLVELVGRASGVVFHQRVRGHGLVGGDHVVRGDSQPLATHREALKSAESLSKFAVVRSWSKRHHGQVLLPGGVLLLYSIAARWSPSSGRWRWQLAG